MPISETVSSLADEKVIYLLVYSLKVMKLN